MAEQEKLVSPDYTLTKAQRWDNIRQGIDDQGAEGWIEIQPMCFQDNQWVMGNSHAPDAWSIYSRKGGARILVDIPNQEELARQIGRIYDHMPATEIDLTLEQHLPTIMAITLSQLHQRLSDLLQDNRIKSKEAPAIGKLRDLIGAQTSSHARIARIVQDA